MLKASPNALWSNGVEDGKKMLASLVVHPVRIVVPVRTQKGSGQENAMLFGTITTLRSLVPYEANAQASLFM